MTTFKELEVSDQILKALEAMGFEEATPIKKETIQHGLVGKDAIGQAQTRTYKTAAFGMLIIERFETRMRGVQGLVIAPTREVAIQVAAEINRLGKFSVVCALAVFGGQL